jgi:CHAT domain-containing protein/lipopolysaccharide biosynthesis regulator YciM
MSSDRQQAYFNLIDRVLTCSRGEHLEILKTHPELLDDDLVVAMLEEADNLREKGELDNANLLKYFAVWLGKVKDYFLAGIALKVEADRLLKEGNQQYAISLFREALQSWEQALTIYQEIRDRQGEAASLCSLGNAYQFLGQYDNAIEFYELSLEISQEIGNRQGESACRRNLALAYYSLGQYHKAIEFYEQSLKISREIGDCQGEAISLGNLGNAYQVLGQFHRAIEFYQQSLEISREIGDRDGEAASLCNLGTVYKSIGQYPKAIEFYEQYLEILQEIGNRQAEASCLGGLGNVYISLGQHHRAIDFIAQSLEISREIGDRQAEASCLGGLGLPYYSLGQYHRAIDFLEQSLEIEREIGNRQGEGDSLGNLGNVYDSLGQYDRAIEFHQQHLEISQEIGNRQGEAMSLGNLGKAYNSLGQYHRAIYFLEQSLEISPEIGARRQAAISLGNLGLAYNSLGKYHKAIEFHQLSLEIKRKIGDREGEAITLSNLSLAYYSLGKYHRAIDFIEQSLEIEREIGNRQGESFALNDIGVILLKRNQLAEAAIALRDSIKIMETMRSELVNNDHKASIFETQIAAYQNLQKVLVAQSKFDEALEISEMSRTRAFVELLQQTLLTNDVPTNNETNKLSIPKIQQIARDRNSTIVEYSIIFDEDIYIWVIQPNGNITHRAANLEPLNQHNQTLKQIILKTRVSIGLDETNHEGNNIQIEPEDWPDIQGYPLLRLLHQILIEPIADLLPTDPNAPIIFIPHYELFLVPFTALQSANNRYLIEDHTILTAPSIQVLEQTSEHQERVRGLRQSALVVGDPTIHPELQKKYKLPQLPWAEEAAEAIAGFLGTTAIVGEKATKVAVLERMLNTRIIHLSAHGLLDDIQGSGIPGTIILAPSGDTDDGALNAVEILQLKKLDSELVVLSACSTGGGKITGDGVNGLSRCFILAGVPSIIVSLWNMGADSAKLVMIEFYQNLQRGDNRDTALRHAMLSAKDEFPSPSDWASFTLIGETETLLF